MENLTIINSLGDTAVYVHERMDVVTDLNVNMNKKGIENYLPKVDSALKIITAKIGMDTIKFSNKQFL